MQFAIDEVLIVSLPHVLLIEADNSFYFFPPLVSLSVAELILKGEDLPLFCPPQFYLFLEVVVAQLVVVGRIFLQVILLQPIDDVIVHTLLNYRSVDAQQDAVLVDLNLLLSHACIIDQLADSD